MTTSDGAVLGATQISGNATRRRGFNIVLLADGFTASEQGAFNSAATAFDTALRSTAPYPSVSPYINVFRVNVTSTDSGADDPSAAGGTGATARTYFDSAFGGNNIQRLLICNNATALTVAAVQVPEFTLVLVVVNSPIYGGSGGSVGTYSLAGGATEIAIHEAGHTAFGLADEYAYYAGGAETGHDRHPAVEPTEPNVTIDPSRANLKWSWAVQPATTLPTMANLNCSVDDPRSSTVPAGTVGCFEGAHYYHCGAYRPEYNCKMRQLGQPFCRVCSRVISNKVRIGRVDSTFRQIVYGGNEAEFVDSGVGRIGEMYGISTDGPLRWYRFQGPPPNFSGGWYRWDTNSGHRIGRGWNGLSSLFSCGNGSLFGVAPNGDLRWYTYKGSGQDDPDVVLTQNWETNSGHAIGNGWTNYRLLAKPYEGNAIFRDDDSAIYAVGPSGDMRWFRYIGDGTEDRSGHTGWTSLSGSTISTGWNRFERIIAISDIILTVELDGTLRWFRYKGNGEAGDAHWDPNSGNVIDRRDTWVTATHVFGGLDYSNGYIIFVVDPNRDLHWYCYTGQGEQDLAFTHWSAFSGTQIGNGW